MRIWIAWVSLVCLVLLGGCAFLPGFGGEQAAIEPGPEVADRYLRDSLVGRWYGDDETGDGGRIKWVAEYFDDGTYRVDFRRSNRAGEVDYTSEIGHWGISGPVFFASLRGWLIGDEVRPADASDPRNYDAYRIISIAPMHFEYEHFANGNRFSVQRVAADFRLP